MADAERAAATALRDVSLDDKYDLTKDRVFITGTQAIIRMLLMQRERDRLAGLNTAGFVSGYRGSPIGGLDQNLWRAKKWLQANDIVFQPGLNEELAATAAVGLAAGRAARRRQVRRRLRRSGTARGRASTAPATCSATPTWRAPRSTAACSR